MHDKFAFLHLHCPVLPWCTFILWLLNKLHKRFSFHVSLCTWCFQNPSKVCWNLQQGEHYLAQTMTCLILCLQQMLSCPFLYSIFSKVNESIMVPKAAFKSRNVWKIFLPLLSHLMLYSSAKWDWNVDLVTIHFSKAYWVRVQKIYDIFVFQGHFCFSRSLSTQNNLESSKCCC